MTGIPAVCRAFTTTCAARGAAASRVLDRVEVRIESTEDVNRLQAVACQCLGGVHHGLHRLPVGADHQHSPRTIQFSGQGVERSAGRTRLDGGAAEPNVQSGWLAGETLA